MRTHKGDFQRFGFHCCLCLAPKQFTCIRAWKRHVHYTHFVRNERDSTTSDSEPERPQNQDGAGVSAEARARSSESHEPQPGTSYQPDEPQPGTSYQPDESQPGTGYQPDEPQPGTSYQPDEPQPGTGYQPDEPQPGTGYQPDEPQPGTSFQPDEPQPGTSHDSMFMVASFLNSLRDQHLPEAACVEVAKFVEKIGKQLIHENESSSGEHPCMDALQMFQSNHKYEKFVKDYLPFVEPETVVVGQKENGKTDSYQYVSLKSQLRHLASLTQLYSCIFEDPTTESENISDVFHGSAHSQRKRNTLYISISYDDFEVANPLGSAAGVHKLATLNCSLLNVPAELRSKVDSIFMLILCLTTVVREYGWSVVLR